MTSSTNNMKFWRIPEGEVISLSFVTAGCGSRESRTDRSQITASEAANTVNASVMFACPSSAINEKYGNLDYRNLIMVYVRRTISCNWLCHLSNKCVIELLWQGSPHTKGQRLADLHSTV